MNQLAENSQIIWLAGMFPDYLQLAGNKTAYRINKGTPDTAAHTTPV